MSNTSLPTDTGPVLRTLSPALRGLERTLRTWLDGTHRFPLSTMSRASLEGISTDLRRAADALDVDRPLLMVMLMGGTGVGKSTLMNALAGSSIAIAGFMRPTTRDPVVYYHESVRPERLDPALRHCKLVPHDRDDLRDKVLVDTPDVDGNDLSNREKLLRILPVADVVLYVGSQEKYHDLLVWEIFREQRKRRAFAFVMNKWDRCTRPSDAELTPDQHWLQDLEGEGFQSPLLFRTCAQAWVDRAAGNNGEIKVPPGEQFRELVNWLEHGLTRLEIEAIKSRGVSQLLAQTQHALHEAAPPELAEAAQRVRAAWAKPLADEAAITAGLLVDRLEPHQRDIEYHFALEGQRRFRGLMLWYLQMVTRTRHVGSSLRKGLPFALPKITTTTAPPPPKWDPTHLQSAIADGGQNDGRIKALTNRLLVDADEQSFPLSVLTEPVEALAHLNWQQRWERALGEVLDSVEKQWTRPTGTRKIVQGTLVVVADWLPPLALLASLVNLLWRVFDPSGRGGGFPGWIDVLMPVIVLLVVLLILHLLINLLLPLRWNAIRDTFHKELEERVRQELESAYLEVPNDVAQKLKDERRAVESLMAQTREVATWLEKTERGSATQKMYGS